MQTLFVYYYADGSPYKMNKCDSMKTEIFCEKYNKLY